MTLECILYTFREHQEHKTSNTAMRPACADPSWVGWPGKKGGNPNRKEELLTEESSPSPASVAYLEIRETPYGLELKGAGLGNE